MGASSHRRGDGPGSGGGGHRPGCGGAQPDPGRRGRARAGAAERSGGGDAYPASSTRSRRESSTARSCAPCRGWRNTTSPSSGRRRWSGGVRDKPVGSIHGRCRVHRAEILRLRGSCLEAETEALAACEELRPYLRREFGWPLTELGRIRLRRGDIQGAEDAFLAAHQAGWDPQPGLALVRLAQGDIALAAALVREALDHPSNVPSKEFPPNTDLVGRRSLPRKWRSRSPPATSLGPDRPRTSSHESRRCSKARRWRRARPWPRDRSTWRQVTPPALAGTSKPRPSMGRDRRALRDRRRTNGAGARLSGRGGRGARHAGAPSGPRGIRAHRSHLPGRARGGMPMGERVTPPPVASGAPEAENVFRREGDYWSVAFEGHVRAPARWRGVRYLARLLANPGREFHVLDLVAVRRVPRRDRRCRRAGVVGSGCRRCGRDARCSGERGIPPSAHRDRRRSGGGARARRRLTGRAGHGRTRLPRARALTRGWTRRTRPTRRFLGRARPSQCDTRGATRHGPYPCPPSSARRAPRAGHPDRHLLRLSSRPSRPRRVEGLAITSSLARRRHRRRPGQGQRPSQTARAPSAGGTT